MKKYAVLLLFFCLSLASQDYYRDGVLTGSTSVFLQTPSSRVFNVVDSFPSPFSYSMGLGCDGRYLWNDDAFTHTFARIDPLIDSAVNTFTPTYGDRDMAFDGTYLWASDWATYSIYKYDTSNCAIVASYDPPFADHAHGMAWDGAYLWVGEESGRIYKMNTIGDTLRSLPSPGPYPSDPRGLAFVSGHLWVGHQGYGCIYEIDTITGAIINFYNAPGTVPSMRFQQGLDFDGQYLWSTVGGDANMLYKIDIGMVNVEEQKQLAGDEIKLNIRPNPLVRTAAISFTIQTPSTVQLSVIDESGRTVSTIIDRKPLPAGNYRYDWQAGKEQNGVYFVVLRVNGLARTVKLIKL